MTRLFHFALMIAILMLLAGEQQANSHDHWISRNPTTAWCCNRIDCRALQDGEAAFIDGKWTVNGVPVFAGHIYPVTADDPADSVRFHACFFSDGTPRCLFVPAMF
jgi:hypothetical protein